MTPPGAYDADGAPDQHVAATDNPSSPFRTTTTTYNAAGKVVTITNPDGAFSI